MYVKTAVHLAMLLAGAVLASGCASQQREIVDLIAVRYRYDRPMIRIDHIGLIVVKQITVKQQPLLGEDIGGVQRPPE